MYMPADLDLIVHRVKTDPTFRSNFLVDPERAISEAGWDLPAEDVAALKDWHSQMHDVSKLDELEHALADFVSSRKAS